MNEYECKRERGYNKTNNNSYKFNKCTHKCGDRQTLYHTCYGCPYDRDTTGITSEITRDRRTNKPTKELSISTDNNESYFRELEEREIEQYLYY